MNFRKFRRQSGYSRHGYPARFITLFLTVSLIFGLFAHISTVAAQEAAFCGLEAHSHTEECYRVFLPAEEETVTASTPETQPETTP